MFCLIHANENFSNRLPLNLLLHHLPNHHRHRPDKPPMLLAMIPPLIEGLAKSKAPAIHPGQQRQPPAKAFLNPTRNHTFSDIRSSLLLLRLFTSIRTVSQPPRIIHNQITVFLIHRRNPIIMQRQRSDIHVLNLPRDLAISLVQAYHLAHRKYTTSAT